MSRQTTLRKRARRGYQAMTRWAAVERLLFGVATVAIEWRRPLKRGHQLPFWNGCPILAVKSC